MRLLPPALLLCLAACNPALNWRETRFDDATVVALLPCKPDRGNRTVPLGGAAPVTLQMAGCEAGGATFAVMLARLDDAGATGAALAGWKAATLVNMRAGDPAEAPFRPPGNQPPAHAVRVRATGQQADGRAVQAEAVWLAWPRGSGVQLVHAVVYADRVSPDVADTFFSGLRPQ
jgi:hypothetical protein